ncbi:MAG: hemerythrin domain-containing protein [Chloroflexota bacterium]
MTFSTPQPMKLEHDELHADLAAATSVEGPIGDAAKAVSRVLHPHFLKEDEYALPPLGLLSTLSQNGVRPEMGEVLKMTDRLRHDLPEMLEEHRAIVAALDHLANVAQAEGQQHYVTFAKRLKLHAQTEEEVSYPAALLIGEYVRLKLGK